MDQFCDNTLALTCKLGVGTITSTYGGGTGPYMIRIDGGNYAPATGSPQSITGLDPGTHMICVKDANGCEKCTTIDALCPPNCNCTLGYPNNNNLPMSAVIFNESEVLRKISPDSTTCSNDGFIRVWYNDEHALTFGVRSVSLKTISGTTTTSYPVSVYTGVPGCITNPLVGATDPLGDQSGN